jgi:adenylate kinase
MRKILCITLLLVVCTGALIAADLLPVNKSTIYKVERDAIWTTSLNMLQVITKHCVTNTTKIYLDGKPTRLSDLKPGMPVVIYYRNDPCKTAVLVRAYSR